MTAQNTEKFQQNFQAGQTALEQSQYQLSVQYLEAATELVAENSRRGGEAQIWLVTAYQAANRMNDAISLCEKLIVHPNLQTREQAQRILYIMKAPQLERPPEWMSEIPDLTASDQSTPRYVTAKKQTEKQPEEFDFSELQAPPANSQDNQFVLFAVGLIALILGSLVWFGRV